jgi:hypothetical protein
MNAQFPMGKFQEMEHCSRNRMTTDVRLPHPANPKSSRAREGPFPRRLRLALALGIIALTYFYRLDQPLLWEDEADTGVEARSVLLHGYPLAYDGRNVSVSQNGGQLNRDLVCNKIPWMQYYVGALSLLIFGNDTLGLRVLFVFCGLLTFFPIYEILKSRLRYPALVTTLILIAPQVVLFQRNARYYPLLILVYALLTWHVSLDFKSARTRFLLAVVIFILFFHIHSLAALCSATSLVLFCLLLRRNLLLCYACACAIGFASWLAWSLFLGPSLAPSLAFPFLNPDQFDAWFQIFYSGMWATLIDADAVDCLPLLLWGALITYLLVRHRRVLQDLFREKLYAFILLNILIQALVSATLFGGDTAAEYSMLRYQPHLLVFELALTFVVLNAAVTNKNLYVLLAIGVMAFNTLTLSFWADPFARHVPVSWFLPVYAEIIRPRSQPLEEVTSRLKTESEKTPTHDALLLPLPSWAQDIMIFYLGNRYTVRPIVQAPNDDCEQALRRVMGAPAFNRLLAPPDWIVDFGDDLKAAPVGYGPETVFASHELLPCDGTRPELTRHTFPQSAVVANVALYHRVGN